MIPHPGDRIKVIDEMRDPDPMEIGATGTVLHVWNKGGPLEQVQVDWDNGRTLMLIPPDYKLIRRLAPEEEQET